MLVKENVQKEQDFTIYNKIKDFNCYVRTNVANSIPSIYRDMRIHLLDECYNLISLLFGAIYSKGNIRLKYLNDIKVKLSLIDYLFSGFRDNRIIKDKTLNVAISKLATIKNIIYGWIINEEKGKK